MRISWYILRHHIGPFIFGTSVVVFVFFLQFLYKVLNDLLGKGISPWVIGKFFAFSLAWMIVLAVPMGMLMASLMAYGKISGSNELTIIKASGGSAFRAMLPSIIAGLVVYGLLFLYDDRVLPETNHRAYVMQNDIRQVKPTLAIEPGRFSQIQSYSILARRVDHERNVLYEVTVYQQDGDRTTVINAQSATLRFNGPMDRMVMTLHNGEIQQVDRRNSGSYRIIAFGDHRVIVATSGFGYAGTDPTAIGRNDRTMSIDSMRAAVDRSEKNMEYAERRIDSLLVLNGVDSAKLARGEIDRPGAVSMVSGKSPLVKTQLESERSAIEGQQHVANQFLVEIHKKYAIPAACLIFVLVGAPLGIVVRRGNFGVSATIALGFYILYWASLVSGEKLADRSVLPPWLAMWQGNIVIGLLGIYLIWSVSRERQAFSFDFGWLRRLVRRKGTQQSGG